MIYLFIYLFIYFANVMSVKFVHRTFLSEREKVQLVMHRFTPVPTSQAQDGNLMMLVGRVCLATNPHYAPAVRR